MTELFCDMSVFVLLHELDAVDEVNVRDEQASV